MNSHSIIGIIIAVLILIYVVTKRSSSMPLAETEFWKYGSHINAVAIKYGVPARRIASIILVESALKANAVGSAGERGLMQLKQGALSDVNSRFNLGFSFDDLFDDLKNIEAGTAYLSLMLKQTGNINDATKAYNVGIGTWRKNQNAGIDYLNKVLAKEKTTSQFFL